jgi:L-glutamine-phosphate cytidylyltransferase
MNAIILAAGLGTRLSSITIDKPKPLIEINGICIIERQIQYLKEIGITEIYIVVGYKYAMFSYLRKKYNVILIQNSRFAEFNNLYSLYLVKDFLGDTYIIEGDVFLERNFLEPALTSSVYFSGIKKQLINEWILRFTSSRLLDIIIYNEADLEFQKEILNEFIMSGVSFWVKKDTALIRNELERIINKRGEFIDEKYKSRHWDYIIVEKKETLSINIIKLDSGDWHEIDSYSDLADLKKNGEQRECIVK